MHTWCCTIEDTCRLTLCLFYFVNNLSFLDKTVLCVLPIENTFEHCPCYRLMVAPLVAIAMGIPFSIAILQPRPCFNRRRSVACHQRWHKNDSPCGYYKTLPHWFRSVFPCLHQPTRLCYSTSPNLHPSAPVTCSRRGCATNKRCAGRCHDLVRKTWP